MKKDMAMPKNKLDKRFPYSLNHTGLGKLNLLRKQFNTMSLQDTLDSCIDDCYARHYLMVIQEAQRLAEPGNSIRCAQRNARPQG
jgi:hypothetical protein